MASIRTLLNLSEPKYKIAAGEKIIGYAAAHQTLKVKWQASPEEILFWLSASPGLTCLKSETPDKTGEIEIDESVLPRDISRRFFVQKEIEDFKPTPQQRLIPFTELMKREKWEEMPRPDVKNILIEHATKVSLVEVMSGSKPFLRTIYPYGVSETDCLPERLIQEENALFLLKDIEAIEQSYLKDVKTGIDLRIQEETAQKIREKETVKPTLKDFVHKQLDQHLKEWRKEGFSNADIAEMIQKFAPEGGFHKVKVETIRHYITEYLSKSTQAT